jgi:hypothetical protein
MLHWLPLFQFLPQELLMISIQAKLPDHSSPAPAPSSVSSPPSPLEPFSPPQKAVQANFAPTHLALSPTSSSMTSPDPPTPQRTAAQEIAATPTPSSLTSPVPLATAGPPTPPPWPEAYVFSSDLHRIVCRKCCNHHYNFRWYNHCFMCNRS